MPQTQTDSSLNNATFTNPDRNSGRRAATLSNYPLAKDLYEKDPKAFRQLYNDLFQGNLAEKYKTVACMESFLTLKKEQLSNQLEAKRLLETNPKEFKQVFADFWEEGRSLTEISERMESYLRVMKEPSN
jgi:hypothetical protein